MILSIGTVSLALGAGTLLAGRPDVGQVLHDEDCTICHNSSVYTRADRKVQSLERLRRQVNLCQGDVGAEWSEAQVNHVIEFLNTSYYKFE